MKVLAAVLSLSVLGLSGCGMGAVSGGTAASGGGAGTGGLMIQGTVHGGQQPLSGSMVALWTVGTGGYASAPTQLTHTTSLSNGYFALPAPSCASPSELTYLTATGGSPGPSNPANTDIYLMAVIGACSGAASMNVNVDEVTTVASVYALAQFMDFSTGNVGYPSASSVGITNAFATVNNLVNVNNGTAYQYTPAGNGLVPQAEIDTLANLLATCVNSSGGTAGQNNACGNLFTDTTVGSNVPANTLQAILNIALHPAANPSGQWGLVTTNGPFQPTLPGPNAPNDWAMPVLYAGTGPLTEDLAIDASGDIWTANYGGSGNGSVSELSPTGQTFPNSPYLSGSDGWGSIAVDLSGNAWVANYYTAQIEEITAGASIFGPFSFPETSNVSAVAVDGSNDIWLTNSSSGTVTEMNNVGAVSHTISPAGGYSLGSSTFPSDVAIDANGNAWVTEDAGTNALSKITPAGSISGSSSSALNEPTGVAIDQNGDLWVTDSGTSNVVEFNSGGTQTLTTSVGNGLVSGSFDAVDGLNNIWTVNSEIGNSIAEFNASGTLLSPSSGFQPTGYQGPTLTIAATGYSGPSLSSPFVVRVDQSGNLWVTDQGTIAITSGLNAGVTEFIGLGAPTIEPLAVAAQQGLIGQRPGTSPGTTLVVTTNSVPNAVSVGFFQTQLLAKGGTGNGYTWQVISGQSSINSLGNAGLTSSGLLEGDNLSPGTATFTVQVTDSAGNTAVKQLTWTVNQVTTLSITTTNLPSATVGVNYSQQFAAAGGSGSYSWSIPNTAQYSALSSIGVNFSLSGGLAGTPTASTAGIAFTVKVTDLATGQTATAPYTFIANNPVLSQCTHDGSGNAVLNGHYAFLLTGFDSQGYVLDQVGSFKADGAGNISNGMGDENDASYATQGEQNYTFTGTYSIGSSDDRGQMVINASNNTSTQYFCFAADTISAGVATSGRVINATGDGSLQTGVFQIQNSSDFTASALFGGYAFGAQGQNVESSNGATTVERGGLAGQVTLSGSGSVSSGQVDIATYKSSTSSTSYTSAATLSSGGTYTMGSGGRGTLTISAGGGGASFIIYQFGNASGFFMLSSPNINTNTLLAGYAMQQRLANFTTANVAAKGVFREDGIYAPGSLDTNGVDSAQIGQLSFDGSGNATYLGDENQGGTITPASGPVSANYSVTSLGYLTLSNAGSHPPNFYLYQPGGGFGLDGSSSVGLWVMVPQTGAGSFTSSSLSGSYGVGTVNPLTYDNNGSGYFSNVSYPNVFSATATFSSGSLSLVQDEVESPGTIPYVTTDQTGTESWTLDPTYGASTGRFTAGQTIGYIVSPTQAILMSSSSGKNPQVIVADHQ